MDAQSHGGIPGSGVNQVLQRQMEQVINRRRTNAGY
jgi:hypothetical protein